MRASTVQFSNGMSSKPVLFSMYTSSSSWRVRIVLALKGVQYEYKTAENCENYKHVNPMNQVPALVVNNDTLIQSLPIIEYLEETYPSPSLLPTDPIHKAKVRGLVEVINSGIQPLQNRSSVIEHLNDENKENWAKHWITRGFIGLERMLTETSGRYCHGDEITLADVFLLPQVFNAKGFQVDVKQFPIITRISEELCLVDAFRLTQPSLQPDCPYHGKDQLSPLFDH